MKKIVSPFLLAAFLFTGCTSPTPTPAGTIQVQFSAATTAWLADMEGCARNQGVVVQSDLRIANTEDAIAEVVMRIGYPESSSSAAFQIGSEDLLVIVNPQNPGGHYTTSTVRGLFSGQIQNWKEVNGADAPVQVWVFPDGEDVMQIF